MKKFRQAIIITLFLSVKMKINSFIQRIDPVSVWDDIVFGQVQKNTLEEIASLVKKGSRENEKSKIAKKKEKGSGIIALFTGRNEKVKTIAAEVLAKEIQLGIYRIDLSKVVSKYIGETEKNLQRVFDAADITEAILLFDEADALFGKRSEVKDSHDRYSNIEVNYLLQQLERYRGVAILNSKRKTDLDEAFMRRIRFVIHF